MSDLLVSLYDLPEAEPQHGYSARRAMAYEGEKLRKWVEANFSAGWASEILPAISRTPSTVFIAVETGSRQLAGFCAWDCTALGFLGPVGVVEKHRGTGVGRVLTLKVLHAMKEQGYGYGIIGSAGPAGFFHAVCDAAVISNSAPGIYPEGLK